MNTSRIWRKNKTSIIFGGALLLASAFSVGDLMDKGQRLGVVRQQITQNTFDVMRIQKNEETNKELQAIANKRMKRGCIPLVDNASAKNLVTLTEGKPVHDRKTNAYLSAGVIVCGANGETAVLANNADGVPVISDIAVGDRELLYQNLKKIRGARVYYNTPEVGK
ncbi:MAG: hypothetical protein KME52_18415 [Desmonostoc geniculatum HA4340-LM1]|jgi:hypothetical protein|nr:hypothetical protein [Desmonostoc geniculatum HA4340-LM1]